MTPAAAVTVDAAVGCSRAPGPYAPRAAFCVSAVSSWAEVRLVADSPELLPLQAERIELFANSRETEQPAPELFVASEYLRQVAFATALPLPPLLRYGCTSVASS